MFGYELYFILNLGHSIGRTAFIDHEIILPVSKLFDDKEDIARKNAHKALQMVSEAPLGKLCSILSTFTIIFLNNQLDEVLNRKKKKPSSFNIML